MKKIIFLLLLLVACTAQVEETTNVESTLSENTEVVEIAVTARQFEFIPSVIEVNEGDTVILKITSIDVDHGIMIPKFGVNERVPVGGEITVQFVASEKGTYDFFCQVYCGEGHKGMQGTLVVN